MRITKMWVSYERGVGLKGYSNHVRFGEGMNALLDEEDEPLEMAATLFALCKMSVREQTLEILKGAREIVERVVTSLPEGYRVQFEDLLREPNIDLVMGGLIPPVKTANLYEGDMEGGLGSDEDWDESSEGDSDAKVEEVTEEETDVGGDRETVEGSAQDQ